MKDSRCEKKRKVIGGMSSDCNKHSRPTDKDMNFSLTFPSLSLQPDDDGSALQKNHADLGSASENTTTKTDIMGLHNKRIIKMKNTRRRCHLLHHHNS